MHRRTVSPVLKKDTASTIKIVKAQKSANSIKEFRHDLKTVIQSVPSQEKSASTSSWTRRMLEIKNACANRSDEEIHLYECIALGSWEHR